MKTIDHEALAELGAKEHTSLPTYQWVCINQLYVTAEIDFREEISINANDGGGISLLVDCPLSHGLR